MTVKHVEKRGSMVRPKNKSVVRRQAIVESFSKPVELVVDPLSCTFAAEKAYLEAPLHPRFKGCKGDSKCFAVRIEASVETCARQVLKQKSNILSTDNVVGAVMIGLQTLDGLQRRRRVESWKVPDGLCLM